MQYRRKLALILALLAGPAAAQPVAQHQGTYIWREDDPDFGGFSAIEITADGTRFHALTDRAQLFLGQVRRDDQGTITGLSVDDRAHLRDRNGTPLPPGHLGDSEGIALAPDGRIWVSFEGLHRVVGYDDPHGPADPLPHPPKLPGMTGNAGLEALALHPDGRLVAVPERSADAATPFQVLVFEDGQWTTPMQIRRDGQWLAVGADYGPDGRFYLLERSFLGPLGFRSRVRSMELNADGPRDEHILIESRPMQYDNLEGISVWGTPDDIRVTLISDDNFLFLQRTEIVEYRVTDSARQAAGN
jgi:hypothetical protein